MKRLLLLLTIFSSFFFAFNQRVSAQSGCQLSCQATFYSDGEFQNQIQSLNAGDNGFGVGDLYVAYQICEETTNVSIGACFSGGEVGNWGCVGSDLTSVNLANLGGVDVVYSNGKKYVLGKLLAGNYDSFSTITGINALEFNLSANGLRCPSRSSLPVRNSNESCSLSANSFSDADDWQLNFTINSGGDGKLVTGEQYYVKVNSSVVSNFVPSGSFIASGADIVNKTISVPKSNLAPGNYQVCVSRYTGEFPTCSGSICDSSISIDINTSIVPTGSPAFPSPLVSPTSPLPNASQTPFNLCQQAGDEVNVAKCNTCFGDGGIWTAIGCIPFNSSVGMIQVFITIGLGIGGGVVVLMVLAGSFLLSTSQGDLKRVDEAKGLIGSAVIGLVFIIFSITILRFIGIRVLQIPGFGS